MDLDQQELTNQIDSIYAEIARLNRKYQKVRITEGGVDNIHRLKDKAHALIKQRNQLKFAK